MNQGIVLSQAFSNKLHSTCCIGKFLKWDTFPCVFTLTPSPSYHTCTGSNIFSQVPLEIYIHRLNRNWFVCCVLAPFIQSPPQYQGAAWLNRLIGSLPASASFSASPHVPLPLPTSTTSSLGRRIVPPSPLRGWRRLSFIVYKVQQKCTT